MSSEYSLYCAKCKDCKRIGSKGSWIDEEDVEANVKRKNGIESLYEKMAEVINRIDYGKEDYKKANTIKTKIVEGKKRAELSISNEMFLDIFKIFSFAREFFIYENICDIKRIIEIGWSTIKRKDMILIS